MRIKYGQKIAALVCVGAFLLTACGKSKESIVSAAGSAVSGTVEAVSAAQGELTVAMSEGDAVNAYQDDGFYKVEACKSDRFLNLMFYDYNACEARFLCNDPACTHDHAGCTSFLDTTYAVSPFVAGGKLYLRYMGYNDGSADKNNWPSALEQRELDGTGAKLLTTAEYGALAGSGTVYTDEQACYIERYGSEKAMLRIDLTTGEQTVVPIPFDPNCMLLPATYEGKMLAFSYEGEENAPDAAKILYGISVQTGERTLLHKWPVNTMGYNMPGELHDGKLYYINIQTGNIMAYDLAQDTDTLVTDVFAQYNGSVALEKVVTNPEGDGLITVPGSVSLAQGWGGRIFGDWLFISWLTSSEDTVTHAYHLKTGERKEITLTDFWNGYEHPMWVMADTPHGLLVLEEHRPFTMNSTGTDGKPYSFESSYEVYALMDLNAYLASQPDFRTLVPVVPFGAN
ncbi:MAG: hypothetical protein RR951_05085 [Ruthenibacterium sp.]